MIVDRNTAMVTLLKVNSEKYNPVLGYPGWGVRASPGPTPLLIQGKNRVLKKEVTLLPSFL